MGTFPGGHFLVGAFPSWNFTRWELFRDPKTQWIIYLERWETEKTPHKMSSQEKTPQEKTPQKSPVEKTPHPILGLVEKTPHVIFRLVEKTPQLKKPSFFI